MKRLRNIRLSLRPRAVVEGAGVHLQRVFGFEAVPGLDPFLLLDDFRSDRPDHYRKGFPWHPHRGIETITYLLKGEVAHGDSLGNSGVICPGDVQWMTAGSGIIHQEMPRGDAHGAMHGFQLWANLPAAQKMIAPRYRGITADRIPTVAQENGVRIKVIAGTVAGARGPVDDIAIRPVYLDCTVPQGATFDYETPADHTLFIYVIGGNGNIADTAVDNRTLVVFDAGDRLAVHAGDVALRFLLVGGKPLNEPVAWQGPIVMNTPEELATAFREYREGTFIKGGPA